MLKECSIYIYTYSTPINSHPIPLLIFVVGCVGKLQQHVFVSLGTGNDGTSAINNRSYYCGSNVKLSCTLISDVILNIARWVKYENGMSTVLNFKPVSNDENIMLDIDVNNDGLYSCQYDQYVSVPMYTFNISITIEGNDFKFFLH